MNDSHNGKDMLIEYADLIDVNEKSQSKTENNVSNNHVESEDVEMTNQNTEPKPPSQTSTPTKAITKQIETRRADGKRRITPMFIPMESDGW